MDAVARRVEDDEIRFLRNLVEHFEDIACEKTAVGQSVAHSIFTGCYDRLLYDLHADHFFCYRRKELRDRTGAGIEIKDRLIFRVADVIPRGAVEYLCAKRIGLEKGERCDLEPESEDRLIKVILSE